MLHCTGHKKGRLKVSDGLSYAKFRFMFNLKSKLTALCWLPVLFVASRLIILFFRCYRKQKTCLFAQAGFFIWWVVKDSNLRPTD
jgi:hypothetical protein